MDRCIKNKKFENAILNKPQACPPIWFMRQAGRYHQHYQKLKEKYTFMQLCKEPDLAAEVALGPVQEFDFDVSILFSDLLFPLEALGMGLTYDPGPILSFELRESHLKSLRSLSEALPYLEFQKLALQKTRAILPAEKSLIGFVGGPWTLFSYATGGKHDGNLIVSKTQLDFFNRFCDQLVPLLIENIRLQLEGGAEIVMIFDTAAGELSPALYNHYIRPQLEKLAKAFPQRLGYYSKGTQKYHLNKIFTNTLWAGFGIDHRWELSEVFAERKHGFLQGNFDQALLFSDEIDFKKFLNCYLQNFKDLSPEKRSGWVCGLGHGVLPKTPEKHVHIFIETVRKTFGSL